MSTKASNQPDGPCTSLCSMGPPTQMLHWVCIVIIPALMAAATSGSRGTIAIVALRRGHPDHLGAVRRCRRRRGGRHGRSRSARSGDCSATSSRIRRRLTPCLENHGSVSRSRPRLTAVRALGPLAGVFDRRCPESSKGAFQTWF